MNRYSKIGTPYGFRGELPTGSATTLIDMRDNGYSLNYLRMKVTVDCMIIVTNVEDRESGVFLPADEWITLKNIVPIDKAIVSGTMADGEILVYCNVNIDVK